MPSLKLITCWSIFMLLYLSTYRTIGFKRTSNINEYLIEDHRTQKRQNYVLQSGMDNEMFDNIENIGPPYATFKSDKKSEELPALIVDYANMIRNDIILLDNSVETRTRKRGNVMLKRHNSATGNTFCKCDLDKKFVPLGGDYIPKELDSGTCVKINQNNCSSKEHCEEIKYNVPVLKRRYDKEEPSQYAIPKPCDSKWVFISIPVTVGCTVTTDLTLT